VKDVEYEDWCTYIEEVLMHPAYKDLWKFENDIFGKRLRKFVEDRRKAIHRGNGDPWKW